MCEKLVTNNMDFLDIPLLTNQIWLDHQSDWKPKEIPLC